MCAVDRVAHRLTDENLTAFGLSGNASRHRDMAPEQVVAAPDRRADMNADSDADAFPAVRVVEEGALHAEAAQHGLARIGERHHESVALILHHVAVVVVDEFVDEFVVPVQHLHPSLVAQGLVVGGRILDVGEGDDDIAVGGDAGEIGPFNLRPAGEVFDRVANRGANAFRQ